MRAEDIRYGDVLVVKTMEEMIADGGIVKNDGICLPDEVFFDNKMKYLCGQTIIVDRCFKTDTYCIVYPQDTDLLYTDNPIGWCLSGEMLKPCSEMKEITPFSENEIGVLLGI